MQNRESPLASSSSLVLPVLSVQSLLEAFSDSVSELPGNRVPDLTDDLPQAPFELDGVSNPLSSAGKKAKKERGSSQEVMKWEVMKVSRSLFLVRVQKERGKVQEKGDTSKDEFTPFLESSKFELAGERQSKKGKRTKRSARDRPDDERRLTP